MAKSGVDRHIKRVSGFCPKCRSIFCDIHSLDSLSRVFQTDKLKVNKCSWMNPLIIGQLFESGILGIAKHLKLFNICLENFDE